MAIFCEVGIISIYLMPSNEDLLRDCFVFFSLKMGMERFGVEFLT